MKGGSLTLMRRLRTAGDLKMATLVLGTMLCVEAVFSLLIVARIPYTEIDWTTYMQQVEGFQEGEWDYRKLGGSTGPLVYPAGFLYLYTGLYWLTGKGHVLPAQLIFVILYLITQAFVMALYVRSKAMPPWTLVLLCLSKRLHSIFMLRMFNDGVAMMLAYIATWLLTKRSWRAALTLFSAAVSVKMNVLLMAPAVLVIILKEATFRDLVQGSAMGVALQLLLGAPFLWQDWQAYLSRAFDFSRVFMYRWTVNLKFLREDLFQAKSTALLLLTLHAALLFYFAQHKWCRPEGGLVQTARAFWQRRSPKAARDASQRMRIDTMLSIIFTANFIGIMCARSLHYQFYSWYFHTLPFLLWQVEIHTIVRCGMLLLVEIIWNIYPSTAASSACLAACHLGILIAMQHQTPQSRHIVGKTTPGRYSSRIRGA